MKTCVIIASHIPTIDKLNIGEDILIRVKKFLPQSDIFVGVNPSNCTDEWINVIKKYTPHYEVTPNHLIIKSDSSAYQTALRLYKDNISEYDLVWFLHTQGTKSGLHSVRNTHLNTLLDEMGVVLNTFNDKSIGAYGHTITPLPNYDKLHDWDFMLDRFGVTRVNRPIRCFLSGTMYVIRGHILNHFITNCNDDFFDKILYNSFSEDHTVGDIWFFERDFIHIVDSYHNLTLCGKVVHDWEHGMDMRIYNKLISEWKNKL